MDSLKIIKIVPFAFAIHNFEEAWAICNTSQTYQNPFVANVTQFIIAVSLFTTLGFVLVFGKKLYKTTRYYQYAITGFSGMLFLNVFFPHVLSAIYLQKYTPGLISAVMLILPLTGFLLWKIFQSKLFSTKQFVLTIFSGGLVGTILVAVFLTIGYILS